MRAALLGAVLCLASCRGGEAEPAAAPPAVPVAPEDVARVVREPIETGPRVAGTLDASRRADVRAEAGGRVLEVGAEIGQRVEKGELLARLEARAQSDAVRAARAAVRSAEEELTVARREVQRTRAPVQGGALPRRDIERAESAAVAAQARVREARAQLGSAASQLADATVRAPMDGVVSAAPVRQGDVVAPGAPLFTIIDPTTIRLEAAVPSEDVAAVQVGTPVLFEVRGYPGQRFRGRIERVAPAADPVTRQIPILVEIPNEAGALVAGLFADGRVVSGRREALVAPQAAVDRTGEIPAVSRINGDVVERVAVQLGIEDAVAERVEVVSGLQEGDRVLLRAASRLPPGTRVTIAGEEQPDAPADPRPPAGPPDEDPAPAVGKPTEGTP